MRFPAMLACALLAASPVLVSAPAEAQQAKRGEAGSDVVLLKNGAMYRGTIAELTPGVAVVILTMTGQTQKFSMNDVAYAGPASSMPQAAPPRPDGVPRPLIQVNDRDSQLHLRSDQTGVTFHLHVADATGTSVGLGGVTYAAGKTYARICAAPCEATLPGGSYGMALSRNNGTPVLVDDMVSFRGPVTLKATYTSYAPLRAVGYVVLIGSLITGGYLMITAFTSATQTCDATGNNCSSNLDGTRVAVGAAIFIGGGIIGSILSGKSDGADVIVLPASAGALPGKWLSGEQGVATSGPLPGATLSMRF